MRRQTIRPWAAALALVLLFPLAGCRTGKVKEDPILRLSAAESLAQGKELMGREKYAQARKYLSHAFEVEPNSASGREALLLVADSLFHQGGSENLIQAEAKYRDFLNRFPTSERAAHVQFQIGMSLSRRVEKPDRDQSVTVQAVDAFRELQRLYPDSEEAEAAQEQIVVLRGLLAQHEVEIAEFYLRYGLPDAAVKRLETVLEEFPDYPEKDALYFRLGSANALLGRDEEAAEWFSKLRSEFPGSEWVGEIREEG